MQGDFDYTITRLRRGWRHRAAVCAVLTPLCGVGACSDVVGALTALRDRWRARLAEYGAAGWELAGSRKRLLYLRNCPPFAVFTAQPAHDCNAGGMLCPFCYARDYPIKAYNFLELMLYGGTAYKGEDDKLLKAPAGVRLVEFQCRMEVTPKGRWGPELAAKLVAAVRPNMADSRRREVEMLGDACGAVLWRVEVGESRLVIKRSGVLLTERNVPRDFEPDAARGVRFRYRVHPGPREERLTKMMLGRAIGRTFSYPTKVFTAPAAEVLAVAEALKGFRQFSTCGGKDPRRFLDRDLKCGFEESP